MLDIMSKVFFLKKVPLFEKLDFQQLIPIAEAMEEEALGPGEYFFRQGDPGDALYIMLDGQAEILLDEKPINTAGPGESFGEIAILDNAQRTAGVRAATDVYVLKISRETFDQLFSGHRELRLAVIQELSARLMAIRGREAGLRQQLRPAAPLP